MLYYSGTLADNDIHTPASILDQFPIACLWRFFIDGYRQVFGWQDFECKEPGYTSNIISAFVWMIDQAEQGFPTLEFIEALQAESIKDVIAVRCKIGLRGEMKGVSYPILCYQNLSVDGLEELKTLCKNSDIIIDQTSSDGEIVSWMSYPACKKEELKNKILLILSQYRQNLEQQDQSTDKKIKHIINLICDLNRSHPFTDGNGRTFCMLLLTRECMRLGMLPPILSNPNIFDGYSRPEIFDEFKKGQLRTDFYIRSGKNSRLDVPVELSFDNYDVRVKKMSAISDLKTVLTAALHGANGLVDRSNFDLLDATPAPRSLLSERRATRETKHIGFQTNFRSPDIADTLSFQMVLVNAMLDRKKPKAEEKAENILKIMKLGRLSGYIAIAIASHLPRFILFCANTLIAEIKSGVDETTKAQYNETLNMLEKQPEEFFASVERFKGADVSTYQALSRQIKTFREEPTSSEPKHIARPT